MKQIAIIGAGGLSGKELIRLLMNHPELELCHITSDAEAGKSLNEVFKDLPLKQTELKFKRHEDPIPQDAIVALAVPNQVALQQVPGLLAKGHKVVDFSGAFRIHDAAVFKQFYGLEQTSPETLAKAAFGIPEIFREKIISSQLVANPGCYPTSVIYPLYTLGDIRKNIAMISISSGSGISGAGGRTEDAGFSFNSVAENYRAYKVLGHQHEPEIKEYSLLNVDQSVELVFTPHRLPLFRGILSTTTILFKSTPDKAAIENAFAKMAQETFIRAYKTPEEISIKNVVSTNYLDVSYRIRGNAMIMVTALDNLVKGAAGQALQNINLMLGMDETLGLLK